MASPVQLSRAFALIAVAAYLMALGMPCGPNFRWVTERSTDAGAQTAALEQAKTASHHHDGHEAMTTAGRHSGDAHPSSHVRSDSRSTGSDPDEECLRLVAPCLCGCDQPVSTMVEVRSPGQLVPGATIEQIARPPRDVAPAYAPRMIEGLVLPIEHVPIPA